MEIIIIILLVVIICLYVKVTKQASETKAKDQKIADNVILIKEAAAAVTILEKKLEEKEKLIHEQDLEIVELEKREKLLLERTQRLREDLKKRTEQYNYLVDFAREHNIL